MRNRSPHRRRRLPRPERGHPRGRAALVDARARGGRRARGLARAGRAAVRAARAAARSPGSCRAAARSSARRARTRTSSTAASSGAPDVRARARRARRDRRRGHARRRREALRASTALPVVGVPKTIDNDLSGTDYTFGFDTAVSICTEAIDRLHTTAESHNRVMVVEVMGRHAGWIAVHSGIAGGADVILIPEQPGRLDEVAARDRSAGTRAARTSRSSSSARAASCPGAEDKGEVDQFGHVLLAKRGVGDAPRPRRSRAAPASRRASPCSATCSAAARRPPRDRDPRDALRAEGRRPRRTQAASARWPRCAATMCRRVSLDEATAELKTVPRTGTTSPAPSSARGSRRAKPVRQANQSAS